MVKADRVCKNCANYEPTSQECRRFPQAESKTPDSWCTSEFISFEVSTHPGTDDNWTFVQSFEGEDLKEVENPLGRDPIISEVVPK